MNQQSYKLAWQQRTEQSMSPDKGFHKVVQKVQSRPEGLWSDWDRLSSPEWAISGRLDDAIRMAVGAWGHEYHHLFLDWATQIADRVMSDPRWGIVKIGSQRGWQKDGAYPGNHGEALLYAALAHAFKKDQSPDKSALVQAAQEIMETALESTGVGWNDEYTQGAYLLAVRALLIAGEVATAREALNIRRKFKCTQNLFEMMQSLTIALSVGRSDDQLAWERFQKIFDVVRDPNYKKMDVVGMQLGCDFSLMRLELALIKHRYLLGREYAGQWQAIIGLISE